MRIFVGLLLFSMALSVCANKAVAEKRIALVIGNGAYDSSPLSDPPNDAALIAEKLRGLEFEVANKINRNQKEMKRLILDFGNRIKGDKNAVGLFYYSGHGMQVGGRNYMIPVGAKIHDASDVEIEGVGVDEVLTRMRYADNAMNLLILDACRDNPYEKRFKSESEGKGLTRMEAPRGTLIAYAAEPNKVALQGPGKYSYFTEALAKEIGKPGVSARDMLVNVRVDVYKKTNRKQLPVVEDKVLSKFYFKAGRGPEGPSRIPASRAVEGRGLRSGNVSRKKETVSLPPGLYLRSEGQVGKRLTAGMIEVVRGEHGELEKKISIPTDYNKHIKGACLAQKVPQSRRLSWHDIGLCP